MRNNFNIKKTKQISHELNLDKKNNIIYIIKIIMTMWRSWLSHRPVKPGIAGSSPVMVEFKPSLKRGLFCFITMSPEHFIGIFSSTYLCN